MHTTSLRKVGGSIMLAVPPAFLDQLQLKAGATVGLAIADGHLIIQPKAKPLYSMAELLAESDYARPHEAEDQLWVNDSASGGELL